MVRAADGFQYPVGPNGTAEGYYIARGYRPNGHLGEDWNGVHGGDTDLGDPVYAAANGFVMFARNYHVGWGNVVILRHAYYEGSTLKYVDSLYGHLLDFSVHEGEQVRRGQQIGRIGNNFGMYEAHLHFEMRKNLQIGMFRSSFARDFSNYYSPNQFVAEHHFCPNGNHMVSVPINTYPPVAPPVVAGPHVESPVFGVPSAGAPSQFARIAPLSPAGTAPIPTPAPVAKAVVTKLSASTPAASRLPPTRADSHREDLLRPAPKVAMSTDRGLSLHPRRLGKTHQSGRRNRHTRARKQDVQDWHERVRCHWPIRVPHPICQSARSHRQDSHHNLQTDAIRQDHHGFQKRRKCGPRTTPTTPAPSDKVSHHPSPPPLLRPRPPTSAATPTPAGIIVEETLLRRLRRDGILAHPGAICTKSSKTTASVSTPAPGKKGARTPAPVASVPKATATPAAVATNKTRKAPTASPTPQPAVAAKGDSETIASDPLLPVPTTKAAPIQRTGSTYTVDRFGDLRKDGF